MQSIKGKIKSPISVFIESKTSRLYVRSYDKSDFTNSISLYSDPELTQFFDEGKPKNIEQIKAYIFKKGVYYFEKGIPFGIFSVFLKDEVSFIGQIDLIPTGNPGEVETGWIFLKKFQNQGYCSEVVNQFLLPFVKNLEYQRVQVFGKTINRVVASVHPENKASQRIMLKSGLSFYKKGFGFGGNPRDWYQLILAKSRQTPLTQSDEKNEKN